MSTSMRVLSNLAIVLFSIGLLLGLALSGWYFWGEAEAALFVSRTGEMTLTTLKCPYMLNRSETGTVSASFKNPTNETIHPTIQAQISHGIVGIPRVEETVLDLLPGQVKPVQWHVSAADKIFGVLILVNVYESSQPNTYSGQGSCGILFFPGGTFSGKVLFNFVFIAAFLVMAGGLIFWRGVHPALRGNLEDATNAVTTLAVVVGLALLFILPRLWVLSGFFFFASILLIGVILTQFILFPGGIAPARR